MNTGYQNHKYCPSWANYIYIYIYIYVTLFNREYRMTNIGQLISFFYCGQKLYSALSYNVPRKSVNGIINHFAIFRSGLDILPTYYYQTGFFRLFLSNIKSTFFCFRYFRRIQRQIYFHANFLADSYFPKRPSYIFFKHLSDHARLNLDCVKQV